ncbi:unnamed protein product [Penicillium salamii]|uniref:Serine/threonine-protein kinase ppk6 n=1 Tax=Penicillium salamii TaxID=1612424 RepID=A0A9W4NCZ0_9EURO|nr:unnamed protein product [Penicillium salamii]
MSADLLAEFGQTKAPANVSAGRQAPNQQTASLFDDLDQETGTFGSSQSLHTGAPNAQFTSEMSWQTATHQNYELPTPQHSDVLFDAAFDAPASDTEDDWGEFEGPESNKPAAPQPVAPPQSKVPSNTRNRADKTIKPTSGTIDLLDSLSIQDSAPVSPRPLKVIENKEATRASTDQAQPTWEDDSFGDWGDFADAPSQPRHQLGQLMETPLTKPPTKAIRKTPRKAPENKKPVSSTWDDASFDDWGDFTDGPVVQPVPKPRTTPTPPVSSPSPGSFTSGATTPAAIVRPTNIPPPSVLLGLFLDVFGKLHKEATHAKSQLRSQASSTPSTASVSTTASNIHNTLQSAARIIAGRSLRWKRDTILSQSMRIGPARSGKAGGMKLNSVNKQENIKEEQDAVDVLIAWRERAAIFNTVLQGAGQRPIPAVPDPSALKVITARTDQGALKASHPCALCSLKRDERVLRVDEQNVQDSFGEWWTEHWGHTACRQFWEANRSLLGQR